MNATLIPQFLMWWLRYGQKFPGLEPESVVARIAANPTAIDYPDDYFHDLCHSMWRTLPPNNPAPLP
ncbi:MAG TPA: hypothetical protein VGJ06_19080 [Candidatus Acidoferrum sp.]|jgi:hypothetical protein